MSNFTFDDSLILIQKQELNLVFRQNFITNFSTACLLQTV